MQSFSLDSTYDDRADAGYISFSPIGPGESVRQVVVSVRDTEGDVILDLDANGKLLGIELLWVTDLVAHPRFAGSEQMESQVSATAHAWGGMPAHEVAAVVAHVDFERVVYQVNGGWAVDAHLGRQTREHGDLDLFVDADAVDEVIDWLLARGYVVGVDERPSRVELRSGEAVVDLHPMVLDAAGDGVQAGAEGATYRHRSSERTRGAISGQSVVIATVERLIALRTGYPQRPRDRHDLQILHSLHAGESPSDVV